MEQVLSSSQGCSDWEVKGKTEWESDQNSLGFLIVDKDNNSVPDSANAIFQDNGINLDLFWASQTYSWENGLDCVYPEWETQPPSSQHLKQEGAPAIPDASKGELACFDSRYTSHSMSNRLTREQNDFFDHSKQPSDLKPVDVAASSATPDGNTSDLGINITSSQTDGTFQETNFVLENTDHRFGCSNVEGTFSKENAMDLLSNETNFTLQSEVLPPVSPMEVSCTDSNPILMPSIICQSLSLVSDDICVPYTASPEPISPMALSHLDVPANDNDSDLHSVDLRMWPEFLGESLDDKLESSKLSASNRTHDDDDPKSHQTTKANLETTQLCSEPEIIKPSHIPAELCERQLTVLSGEKFSGEAVTDILDFFPKATTDNLFDELSLNSMFEAEQKPSSDMFIDHAPIVLIDLQTKDPPIEVPLDQNGDKSTSILHVSTPEHEALIELSPVDEILPEDYKNPTNSSDTEFLSKMPHVSELISEDFVEIIEDGVAWEPIASLIPNLLVADANQQALQDNCDANLKLDERLLNFQDNFTNVLIDGERLKSNMNAACSSFEEFTIFSDLDNIQKATYLKNSDSLENCVTPESNQEPTAMTGTFGEENNSAPLHQLSDSLIKTLNAIAIDAHKRDPLLLDVKEEPNSVILQGGEGLDCITASQSQVVPHCSSNPDSLQSTPFTSSQDQLTVTGGLVVLDLSETISQLGDATGEVEVGFPAQLSHQEDFNQLTPLRIDLAQEQQVSSFAPNFGNAFPLGASVDGEAYHTLMENNPDHPNLSKHAEMTLDLCKASDALPTKSINDQRVPVDLLSVPIISATAYRGEEQSALRAVFQALDQDGDGFVHVEEFIEFAKAYGAEQVKDLTRFLDPSGLGVISFEDFYRGISTISNEGCDPELYKTHLIPMESSGPPEEYDELVGEPVLLCGEAGVGRMVLGMASPVFGAPCGLTQQAEVSDSAYLGSESAYSECETFTDEDTTALVHPELHDDVETDSGIENTLTDGDERNRIAKERPNLFKMRSPPSRVICVNNRVSVKHGFTLGSDSNGHTVVAVIGGEEEHFEDFGESNNTSDLLLTNQEEGRVGQEVEGDAEPRPHPDSPLPHPLMLLSPSPSALPARLQSFLQSEALDFFCTHCHKQISRLEDLSTRLNLLEINSSSKRLSSKKAARHLQQSSNLDVMGELTHDILDLADRDITDKVLLLEKRVCELEKDSVESEEQHARLRQENLTLVHRANALEEQLKEQELRTEDELHNQTRKHRDALNKLQRERELEIENLQARLQQLDEENSELRSCVPCLRANIERLEEEKRKLQDELDDVSQHLNEETESRRKMSDKLSLERHTNQKEKECTQGLIEDLRKQLEHLQLFKLETEARRGRSASSGLQEYNTHMRENELEQEIRRLKQDNRGLKEQNDELNGQIINLSIQGAKSLFTESLSESLAAEINNVSRTELMEAVHKQEEINFRLQDYIDRIIVAIMESNPSILEVKY
ncbi:hypothetical protein DNTS_011678 [Danionella cerebrum]|uniref:EF-hand domain-containing protein n=1 Tax=Danionella cerebrum TaxID=2873325 RepID=A0A553QWA1_9TELE|nr:hypothetical protein DNTS_011678 [Danionella translucida]